MVCQSRSKIRFTHLLHFWGSLYLPIYISVTSERSKLAISCSYKQSTMHINGPEVTGNDIDPFHDWVTGGGCRRHQGIWESQVMSYNPRWSLIRPYMPWFDLIRPSPRIIWHCLALPNFLIMMVSWKSMTSTKKLPITIVLLVQLLSKNSVEYCSSILLLESNQMHTSECCIIELLARWPISGSGMLISTVIGVTCSGCLCLFGLWHPRTSLILTQLTQFYQMTCCTPAILYILTWALSVDQLPQ